MNGPEHYKEAERLLDEGREVVRAIGEERGDDLRDRRDDLGKKAMGIWAQAQAHATLALVAATVDQTAARGPGDAGSAWIEATR